MKTKKWLREQLKKRGMTQKNLADDIGISTNAISKIIRGERAGSPETWKKITDFFNNGDTKISYDCEELLREIEEDILEFGEDEKCYLFYTFTDYNIVFDNYDFIVEEEPLTKEELKGHHMITTLKNAKELFEKQNEMF